MAAKTLNYDAVVIGGGIAGFAAAVALKKRGKKPIILFQGSGATSVSSGAWDFAGNGAEALKQPLIETPVALKEMQEAAEETAKALELSLAIRFNFERGFLLPTSAGTFKPTHGAQAIQAGANVETLKGKRVGLIASESWRFRADLVCKTLSERIRIEPLWIDLRDKYADIPLAHFATRLAFDDHTRHRFEEAVITRMEATHFDALLAPPIFLDATLAEKLHVSELVATVEPTAGERLSSAITQSLQRLEIPTQRISELKAVVSDGFIQRIEALRSGKEGWGTYTAAAYVLATGKFFGGGINLGYDVVRERIFDLPLFFSRNEGEIKRRSEIPWGDTPFRDEQPWARVGVRVDKNWRPADSSGVPVLKNLRACGSIIGGSDFARDGLGLGFMAFTGRQCGLAT